MDFRAAAASLRTQAVTASDTSENDSLDAEMDAESLPAGRFGDQPQPETDGSDPASPGGPAPYNAAAPFSRPVTTDQEWLDPRGPQPRRYQPMPYVPGPDEDRTTLRQAELRNSHVPSTLHNARRAAYDSKIERFRP